MRWISRRWIFDFPSFRLACGWTAQPTLFRSDTEETGPMATRCKLHGGSAGDDGASQITKEVSGLRLGNQGQSSQPVQFSVRSTQQQPAACGGMCVQQLNSCLQSTAQHSSRERRDFSSSFGGGSSSSSSGNSSSTLPQARGTVGQSV